MTLHSGLAFKEALLEVVEELRASLAVIARAAETPQPETGALLSSVGVGTSRRQLHVLPPAVHEPTPLLKLAQELRAGAAATASLPDPLIERLDAISAALARIEGGQLKKPQSLALSRRQAAKLLRIDRGETLAQLIASGQLHLVNVGGNARISTAEVERLAAEGFDIDKPKLKTSTRNAKPRAGISAAACSVGASIRALKF